MGKSRYVLLDQLYALQGIPKNVFFIFMTKRNAIVIRNLNHSLQIVVYLFGVIISSKEAEHTDALATQYFCKLTYVSDRFQVFVDIYGNVHLSKRRSE